MLGKIERGGSSSETEGTVEAPPDGGISAWAVCAGSAILSSANSVVNVSLHETIDSSMTVQTVTPRTVSKP